MHRFFLLVCALVLSACGSNASEFVGTYSMSGTATVTVTSPVRRNSTATATDTVTVTESSSGGLVLSAAGCALNATVASDTAATIDAGQRCNGTGDAAGTTIVVSSGTVTRVGTTLSLMFSGTLSGTVQGVAVAGTYSYSVTGPRR